MRRIVPTLVALGLVAAPYPSAQGAARTYATSFGELALTIPDDWVEVAGARGPEIALFRRADGKGILTFSSGTDSVDGATLAEIDRVLWLVSQGYKKAAENGRIEKFKLSKPGNRGRYISYKRATSDPKGFGLRAQGAVLVEKMSLDFVASYQPEATGFLEAILGVVQNARLVRPQADESPPVPTPLPDEGPMTPAAPLEASQPFANGSIGVALTPPPGWAVDTEASVGPQITLRHRDLDAWFSVYLRGELLTAPEFEIKMHHIEAVNTGGGRRVSERQRSIAGTPGHEVEIAQSTSHSGTKHEWHWYVLRGSRVYFLRLSLPEQEAARGPKEIKALLKGFDWIRLETEEPGPSP